MKQVLLSKLKPGMVLAKDIFHEDQPITAFMRSGAVLTEDTIRRLHQRGFFKVTVEGDGPDELEDTFLKPVDSPLVPQAPTANRSRRQPIIQPKPVITDQLRQMAVNTLEDAFNDISVGDNGFIGSEKAVKKLGGIVGKLVDSLVNNRKMLVNISGLKSYDDYTYHHSLSVAVLSIGIGQELGILPRQLNRLGLCAIMHDIGKISVPIEIIRKPARLSENEFLLIKTHSQAGTNYMKKAAVGDETLWRAVLYHHEKMDGSGYPQGLRGDRIPLWSRIISVADVFDALTSTRPYRTPMEPAQALEYIMGGVGSSFDFEVVSAFVRKIDLYPIGTSVVLSDNTMAVVVDNTRPLRPVVEILSTGRVVDLFSDREYLNVVISHTVNNNGTGSLAQAR